jgi:hypothetical protein
VRQTRPPIIKVQVKRSEGSIGDPVVSALYGKVESREHGLVVTLGTFTPPAKTFAKSRSNLRLIDGDELVKLISIITNSSMSGTRDCYHYAVSTFPRPSTTQTSSWKDSCSLAAASARRRQSF